MLIALGGLPGTGKSTVAREIARLHAATWLRIDVIEQALRTAQPQAEVGAAGYAVAYALARANLALGQTVVADCVNPLGLTRAAWRAVAADAGVPVVEVELFCSDAAEHRRRVESRVADIAGLVQPNWAAVQQRAYERWTTPRLAIDTAQLGAAEAARTILRASGLKAAERRP
ncbi:AAA family ATPase [Pseudorhodoferax sp.]|uniref:AAA family ATPase n=1 Tax=Pseudorhodoferax sp. TaxID=1993553 RepID=UPI002DD68B82|nr:AAA family ATPase [Pseudorhodoferax sp.]